jgi:hypothetical protein
LKKSVRIAFLSVLFPLCVYGQQDSIPELPADSITPADSVPPATIGREARIAEAEMRIDTTKKINYWTVTRLTGEIIPASPDTFLTDYFNRTNPEGAGLAVAYPGNLGLPMESRLFFERGDRSNFMFSDNLRPYSINPETNFFINTKIPITDLSYQSAGSRQNKEERLKALLSLNFGRKLNAGFSLDYLYARGFYQSQSAKQMNWTGFASYVADRHQAHLFLSSTSRTNAENGGLTDDLFITHPELNSRKYATKDMPTNFTNTWNSQKVLQAYLNYRYNLGFEKDTGREDENGEKIRRFVPVSSIIYTFDYEKRSRNFYSTDSAGLNAFYNNAFHLNELQRQELPADSTSYHSMRNTAGLSLREGFSEWAKFDLTAYISYEARKFNLTDTVLPNAMNREFSGFEDTQNSTYIGGELAKRSGKILRYSAEGNLGLTGYNLGDFNVSGEIETRIPLLKDTASVRAFGYIKNLKPTFYENRYHSRYFRWENDFSKVRKVYIGGQITVPQTKTQIGIGVENIENYIYFDETGYPRQFGGNIRVFAASLTQNIRLGALHWDNQAAYQYSSDSEILPLPKLCVYSNLYLHFVYAKVLTVQMGLNAHYFTKYYSPVYEPATQQFRLQKELQVGDYPLVNGYLNCHLKQTRFFVEYYNLGSMMFKPPSYFSMPHYPVNPPVLKLGVAINFIN